MSFSYNDRRYVLRERDIDGGLRFKDVSRYRKINHLAEKLYLYRFMKFVIRSVRKDNNIDVRKLYVRVPPDEYRNNLIKIAKLAEGKKIPLVFISLKENPNSTIFLLRGLQLLKNSQYELATENLKMAMRLNNASSDVARKYLTEAYEQQAC